jgi:hypothetical protein
MVYTCLDICLTGDRGEYRIIWGVYIEGLEKMEGNAPIDLASTDGRNILFGRASSDEFIYSKEADCLGGGKSGG